jgi:hypothetical protein
MSHFLSVLCFLMLLLFLGFVAVLFSFVVVVFVGVSIALLVFSHSLGKSFSSQSLPELHAVVEEATGNKF